MSCITTFVNGAIGRSQYNQKPVCIRKYQHKSGNNDETAVTKKALIPV